MTQQSMSAAKHTPGPWAIGAGYGRHGVEIVGACGSKRVCGVARVSRDTEEPDGRRTGTEMLEEGMADARLISAAPELLAALQDVISLVDSHGSYAQSDAIRAAITKATGPAA